jgi:hypothetical protein
MKKSVKTTIITLVVIITLYLVFFSVITPYIRGVIIDKETKKPVENAWVMAVAGTTVLTVAGDVSSYRLLTRPHTRTDKNGHFTIPPRIYFSFPPPMTFGMSTFELRIDIYAPGGKRGAVEVIEAKRAIPNSVSQDEEGIIKTWPIVRKMAVNVLIPVKNVSMTQSQTTEELGWLSTYCNTGRYYFARPFVERGCDSFEADYVISELLKVVESIGTLQNINIDQRTYYAGALASLGRLYKKKGDYRKAIGYFVAVRDFDKKRNVDINLRIYDKHIKELKEKLNAE